MARNWTWSDYDYIRKEYPLIGRDVKEHFPDTEMETIRTRARRINTSPPHEFTQEEKQLAIGYRNSLGMAMMFLLPDRAPVEIERLIRCEEQ